MEDLITNIKRRMARDGIKLVAVKTGQPVSEEQLLHYCVAQLSDWARRQQSQAVKEGLRRRRERLAKEYQ